MNKVSGTIAAHLDINLDKNIRGQMIEPVMYEMSVMLDREIYRTNKALMSPWRFSYSHYKMTKDSIRSEVENAIES